MNNNSKRRVVLLGLELPDGTLDGQMQALEVMSSFAIKPEGETKERDIVRPSMSKSGSVIGAKNWDITLPLELKGGGLDETSQLQNPPLHPALLACGMVQQPGIMLPVTSVIGEPKLGEVLTNTTTSDDVGIVMHYAPSATVGEGTIWVRAVQNIPADTDELAAGTATSVAGEHVKSLVYQPVSERSQHKTAVIHAHYDGQRRIATRVRGNLSFDWTAGEFCTVQFALKGLYTAPDNIAIPSATFNDAMPPIGESAGLHVGAYPIADGTIEKLSFDAGLDIQAVPDINSPNGRKSYRIADRKSTGSINPESVNLSDFNPFHYWESGEKAKIYATLGKGLGERISVLIPASRFTGISDGERAGSDTYDLAFEATGTDDDEFYLVFH